MVRWWETITLLHHHPDHLASFRGLSGLPPRGHYDSWIHSLFTKTNTKLCPLNGGEGKSFPDSFCLASLCPKHLCSFCSLSRPILSLSFCKELNHVTASEQSHCSCISNHLREPHPNPWLDDLFLTVGVVAYQWVSYRQWVNVCKLLMVLRDKLQSLETIIAGRVWGKRDTDEHYRHFAEPPVSWPLVC